MWHVSSRSGVATLRTAIQLLLVTYCKTGSMAYSYTVVVSQRPVCRDRDHCLHATCYLEEAIISLKYYSFLTKY